MNILHLLHNNDLSALKNIISQIETGHALVVLNDAAYLLDYTKKWLPHFLEKNIPLYALKSDLTLRGLDHLDAYVQIIEMDILVQLTCQYSRCISW